MKKYFDTHFDKDIMTIYPGEFYVSVGAEYISTILGSCVSIVLYDKIMHIGGMNHFILAKDGKLASDTTGNIGRFGEYAIELLINEMVKKGSKKRNWEAKIFGGSNVFNMADADNRVGAVNIKFAYDYLMREGIKIVASDTGGIQPRKIFYDPQSSKIWLKRIRNSVHDKTALLSREVKYMDTLRKSEKDKETTTSDVIWF